MRATLHSVAALAVLTALAGFALAWFADFTQDAVQRNRLSAETRILRELAGVDIDAATSGDLLLCEHGQVIVRGVGRGYGGEFKIAVAVGGDGAVRGVRVIEHGETPGFGDILDAGSPWLASFQTDAIHAVTGATVTSEAAMLAVERIAANTDLRTLCAS